MKLYYGGNNSYTVEPGMYLAVCVGFDEKMSKAGNPMVELTFDINGVKVKDYFLESTPPFKTNGLAASLGYDTNVATRQSFDLTATNMMDRTVEVSIVNEERNGKIYSKIENYLPMGTVA